MRDICYDGFVCCPSECVEINGASPGSPAVADCPDCMQVGSYYVHDQDSVPPGCVSPDSNIQIELDRNDYVSCEAGISSEIISYDSTYLSNVTISESNGVTSIFATIIAGIPHGEYTEILYKVSCPSEDEAVFAWVKLASKHMCLDCDGTCDECTGDCSELDLEVS